MAEFTLMVGTVLLGGVGAALRWWTDTRVERLLGAVVGVLGGQGSGERHGAVSGWGVGTFVVNIVGSFLLGALVGAVGDASSARVTLLGFGLLGGYTTYSSAMVQSVRAAAQGRRAGIIHAAAMAASCLLAATAGLALFS